MVNEALHNTPKFGSFLRLVGKKLLRKTLKLQKRQRLQIEEDWGEF